MPFKKGDTKINRAGRPIGSKNKINGELKQYIKEFLEKNWKSLEKDFKDLKPRDKMKFYTDLLPYVVPKLNNVKSEHDLSNLSPSQLETVADRIIENLTDDE